MFVNWEMKEVKSVDVRVLVIKAVGEWVRGQSCALMGRSN